MNIRLVFAGLMLAAIAVPVGAQGNASCFIDVRTLVAAPPAGLADLHGAIGRLDAALRPQVDEIKRLRAELDQVHQKHAQALRDDDSREDLVALDEQQRRISAELEARSERLKADYAAQQQAIVGPVQTEVAKRAQAFAQGHGCAEVKMARAPDLAALQSSSARDVTGDFVAWYGQS